MTTAGYHDLNLLALTARGRVIRPSANDFVSIAVPEKYQLGDIVGTSDRVTEVVLDGSVTITVTNGAYSAGYAAMSEAYLEQQTVAAGGGSPNGNYSVTFPNGDTIVGEGVMNPPGTLTGGQTSGSRTQTILLRRATFTPAVGLTAALAAAGTV